MKKKVVKLSLSGFNAHFKTIHSNHTHKFTYFTPPKPTLIGMIGAILGMNYEDILQIQDDIKVAWKWKTEQKVQTRGETKQNIAGVKCSSETSNGKGKSEDRFTELDDYVFTQTIDHVQYLINKDGVSKIEADLLIEMDEKYYEQFQNPIYNVYFGIQNCFASIDRFEIIEVDENFDEQRTNFIVSQKKLKNGVYEVIPYKNIGHKQTVEVIKVWYGNNKTKSKYGYWLKDDQIYTIM